VAEQKPQLTSARTYDAIYNQPDPRAYFRTLEPLGYRQPEVIAGFLSARGGAIARHLGRKRLRILDFACGYGALGAMLRHRIGMQDLYDRYATEAGAGFAEADRRYFADLRDESVAVELGGIDIAEQAVGYAQACSLLDQGGTEHLAEGPPGAALAAFFAETDLIVETGAVYRFLPACYASLMRSSPKRPWLLFGPRGDVDTLKVADFLTGEGYRLERVSTINRRYRRFSDAEEQRDSEANMAQLGHVVAERSREGWFVNPIVLARPEVEAAALPIEQLAY